MSLFIFLRVTQFHTYNLREFTIRAGSCMIFDYALGAAVGIYLWGQS